MTNFDNSVEQTSRLTSTFRYHNPHTELMIFGEDAASAVDEQSNRLHAQRVMILTSSSLKSGPLVKRVQKSLGKKHVATYGGIASNAPRKGILSATVVARETDADLLVAIGGGSVIDAAKLVQLCVSENISSEEALTQYDPPRLSKINNNDIALRTIAVPTTLSGAEFATLAGSYNSSNGRKEPFDHPLFAPLVIIEDPSALEQSPANLVITTGIRTLDHCVERFCSTNRQVYSDALALGALKLLLKHLPALKNGSATPVDFGNLQIASWMSMDAVHADIAVGASHAIGRVLGAVTSLSHGHTSAIMLPAVLMWNAHNTQADVRQKQLVHELGLSGSLSSIVSDFIMRLDLPQRLSAMGVKRETFHKIARDSLIMLHHPSVGGNARHIRTEQDILDILELAW